MRRAGGGGAGVWVEMGRLEEAREWLAKALEFEAGDADITGLVKEVDGLLEKRGAK